MEKEPPWIRRSVRMELEEEIPLFFLLFPYLLNQLGWLMMIGVLGVCKKGKKKGMMCDWRGTRGEVNNPRKSRGLDDLGN